MENPNELSSTYSAANVERRVTTSRSEVTEDEDN